MRSIGDDARGRFIRYSRSSSYGEAHEKVMYEWWNILSFPHWQWGMVAPHVELTTEHSWLWVRDMNADETTDEEVLENENAEEQAAAPDQEVEEAEVAPEEAPEPTPEEQVLIWKETAMRTAAELENYRKRMAREKSDAIRYANSRLLEDLLPALDNFEMGMLAASKEEGSMIHLGMSMVQKQLNDFLENQGASIVKAEGVFDPTLHEAVSEEESADLEPGTIIRVMRRGFMLNDRLLRPATVVVAKAPEEKTEEDPS